MRLLKIDDFVFRNRFFVIGACVISLDAVWAAKQSAGSFRAKTFRERQFMCSSELQA